MFKHISAVLLLATFMGCGGEPSATSPDLSTPALSMADGTIFPANRSLTHAEDGVILTDGSVLVGDWDTGLVLLSPDGSNRAFGDFTATGFKTKPAGDWNSPNGISWDPDGRHVLVADINSGHIYRVDTKTESVTQIHDHPFGVNSVVRDPTGAIWFTQSTENAAGEGSQARMFAAADRPLTDGAVFRIAPEDVGKSDIEPERVIEGLAFANGIAFDAARNRLYVAELMAHRVLSFDVDAQTGALTNRRMLVDVVTPDNIELDRDGNLWIASPAANAVYIVDPDTEVLRKLFDPSPETSQATIAKVRERAANGEGILDMIGPEMSDPMPGLLTGVILSSDLDVVYVSGLGDALVRLELD